MIPKITSASAGGRTVRRSSDACATFGQPTGRGVGCSRQRRRRRRMAQLGMVGLGRMGANLVRRLMRDGHDCVVYDVNPDAIKQLAGEGATGAVVARRSWPRSSSAAGRLDHGPGRRDHREHRQGGRRGARQGRRDHRRRQLLLPRRHPPLEDGRREGHRLHRLRDQRRRLRPRPRLLPDDRRPGRGGGAPRPDLQDDRARASSRPSARRAAAATPTPPRTATCTAGRTAPATS